MEQLFQYLYGVLALNPAASVCIILGGLLLILSLSGQTEIGGLFKMTVDGSSRVGIRRIAAVLITAGLVMILKPSFSSLPSFSWLNWSSPVDKLHKAAIAWDEASGAQAIEDLRKSGDECNQILADWAEWSLAEKGIYGFNEINAIQLYIEQINPQCSYPQIDHPDQSVRS